MGRTKRKPAPRWTAENALRCIDCGGIGGAGRIDQGTRRTPVRFEAARKQIGRDLVPSDQGDPRVVCDACRRTRREGVHQGGARQHYRGFLTPREKT